MFNNQQLIHPRNVCEKNITSLRLTTIATCTKPTKNNKTTTTALITASLSQKILRTNTTAVCTKC